MLIRGDPTEKNIHSPIRTIASRLPRLLPGVNSADRPATGTTSFNASKGYSHDSDS